MSEKEIKNPFSWGSNRSHFSSPLIEGTTQKSYFSDSI